MLTIDNILNLTADEFLALSEDDKTLVREVLFELKDTGESETLRTAMSDVFDEIPVSIDEFISSPEYLGEYTRNGEAIYPYWRSFLSCFFGTNKHEMLLTGAIGTGRTRIFAICACYVLYKLMCLKNPQEYFKLPQDDSISLFFLNTSITYAEGECYKTVHDMLLHSPWFMKRGKCVGKKYKPAKNIKIMVGAKSTHTLGHNIFAVFVDEPVVKSYSDTTDCQMLLEVYNQCSARIQSRFCNHGDVCGYKFMVSTKLPIHSVISRYIETVMDCSDVLVSDEPLWRIKPDGTFSNLTFAVAYGGNLLSPQIVPDSENAVGVLADIGCDIVWIPDNFYDFARLDVAGLLRQVAGIEC